MYYRQSLCCCFFSFLFLLLVGCPPCPQLLVVKWKSWGATGIRVSGGSHRRMRNHRKFHWWCNIKEFPSKVPSPSVPPRKKSQFAFSRARITPATAQGFCSMLMPSPVQHLAKLAYVPSCCPLFVGSTWPWAMSLLGPHSYVGNMAGCKETKGTREGEYLCLSFMYPQMFMGLTNNPPF